MQQTGKFDPNQLSTSRIGPLLRRLAVPAILAQLVNLLYNLVDRIYIGHLPQNGDLALTGLGLCFPVIMLISAFSMLIGQGGAPRAAIRMGQNNNDAAEEILGTCTASLFVLSVVLTIVLELTARPILIAFGASEYTLPYALSYMRIYIAGTLFVMFTLGLNLFINTQGFATIGMKTVIIGAVCNIVLDPVFIFGLNMGVRGAALATILSQGVSAVWVCCFLCGKRTQLHIRKHLLRIRLPVLLPVMALGVSPFIMSATESLVNIAFNKSLSVYGGDLAVGAMTILASIMQLQFMPVQGMTQGAQPIISYNYGAGNTTRVRQTYRLLIAWCIGYTLVFCAAVELFPGLAVRIFNNRSPELIALTSWALRIYLAGTCIFGLQMAVQQTFLALGQAKISLFIACLRKIILLIPLILILPHFFENKVFAVFLAEPISDVLSALTAGTLFLLRIPKILARPPEK